MRSAKYGRVPWRYIERIIGEERGYGGCVIAVKVLVRLPVDLKLF
jgi:hypothetical protein